MHPDGEKPLIHESDPLLQSLWAQKDIKDAIPLKINDPKLPSKTDVRFGLRDTGSALIVGLFSLNGDDITPLDWMNLRRTTNSVCCDKANDITYAFGYPNKRPLFGDKYFTRLAQPSVDQNQGIVVGYQHDELKGHGLGQRLIRLSLALANIDHKWQVFFIDCNAESQRAVEKSGVNISDRIIKKNKYGDTEVTYAISTGYNR